MRVLGIDPGSRLAGFGVVESRGSRLEAIAYGPLRAEKEASRADSLLQIYRGFLEVVAEHHPDVIAVEEAYGGRNIAAALRVGEARGIALLAAAETGLPIAEYVATTIKKAVVGTGRAEKRQVQEMVKRLLSLEETPRPDDAADALAVAICHCLHG